MGFWNSLTKVGRKLWDGIKKPVSSGYHFLKEGMSGLRHAGNWIDEKLTELHNIPILGELATVIQTNPIYQGIGAGFGEAELILDLAGEIGRDVNTIVEGGLGGSRRGRFNPSPISGGISRANQLTERSVPNISPLSGLSGQSFAIS